MSTDRRSGARPEWKKETGPTGRRLCTCGCGREVPKGRISWFSQECVDDWLVRKGDVNRIRQLLAKRDLGICAICGVNAEKLYRVVKRLWYVERGQFRTAMGYNLHPYRRVERLATGFYSEAFLKAWQDACFGRSSRITVKYPWVASRLHGGYRSFWEADHIVPVVEGGGGCGLDGYRTLCVRCHRAETRELHRRLRDKKRKQPPLSLEAS
jgi:5-methylcytosine-specific restriction protein A